MKTKFSPKQNKEQVTVNLGDGKPLVVSQTGGNLTGLGGLPLLTKVEKSFKLIAGAAKRLKEHRTKALILHNKFDVLMGRVAAICAGMSDTNDMDLLKQDAGLLKVLGRDPEDGQDGASQPTYSRFENSVDEEELKELAEFLVDYYTITHRKAPGQIILYCDGSAVETYGVQEASVYRGGKYKKEMFFPLFVFDQQGWLLAAQLRAGDQSEARTTVPVLKNIVEKLRKAWPGVKIALKADAAFACPSLFDWCEELGIRYIVGIAGNFAVVRNCLKYLREAKRQFVSKFGQPQFVGDRKTKAKWQKIHAKSGVCRLLKERKRRRNGKADACAYLEKLNTNHEHGAMIEE